MAPRHLSLVWAGALGLPAAFGFAAAADFPSSLGIGFGCGALGGAIAFALSRSSIRYGVGFVPLARAVWGPVGALPVLLLRWGIGVFLLAAWLRALIDPVLVGVQEVIRQGNGIWGPQLALRRTIGWEVPGLGIPAAAGALALLALVWAYWVAVGGMSRIVSFLRWGSALIVGGTLAGIILGGIRSKGFGSQVREGAVPENLLSVTLVAAPLLLGMLPVLITSADWMRFSSPDKGRERVLSFLTPWVLAPVLLFVGFGGGLILSAAATLHGFGTGGLRDIVWLDPIFGPVLLFAIALGAWSCLAPAWGLYANSLLASGLAPRRIGYSRGLRLSVVATWVAVLTGGLWGPRVPIGDILLLGIPVLIMLLVDETVVRRGRLQLDDAYIRRSAYGPVLGTSPAAVATLVFGLAAHPTCLSELMPYLPGPFRQWEAALGGELRLVFGAAAMAIVTVGAQLSLVPLERALRWLRRRITACKALRAERRLPPKVVAFEGTAAGANTNPNFDYSKVEDGPTGTKLVEDQARRFRKGVS